YEMAMALANSRWVPQGLYDRAVKALGHVGITDVITLMGYYTSVSMTLAFYDVPVRGAQGAAKELVELSVPAKYRWVPDGLPGDSRYNVVAQLYARLAESIRDGKPASPSFAAAVTRHRLLDAIMRASETERKQVL